MATAVAVINSRREMKERTNAAIMMLSLLDCHFKSHVSTNKVFPRMNLSIQTLMVCCYMYTIAIIINYHS